MLHARRSLAGVASALALVAVLAGCGEYRTARLGPLHYVGTIDQSGPDGAISTRYLVGPIIYGPDLAPPQAALKACNARFAEEGIGEDYADPNRTKKKTAYSPGRIVVTYRHGSLPVPLSIDPDAIVQSSRQWSGITSVEVGGVWHCAEGPVETALQPGQTARYDMWILSDVLSRGRPRVPRFVKDSWQFEPEGVGAGLTGEGSKVRTSGPGSARCNREDILRLYARLPFKVQSEFGAPGKTVACTPTAGT